MSKSDINIVIDIFKEVKPGEIDDLPLGMETKIVELSLEGKKLDQILSPKSISGMQMDFMPLISAFVKTIGVIVDLLSIYKKLNENDDVKPSEISADRILQLSDPSVQNDPLARKIILEIQKGYIS